MMRVIRHRATVLVRAGLVCLLAAWSTPAFAAPKAGDHGGDHAADHGGDHGGGHGGLAFTGDDDGDGTANWMDPDAGEHFVADDIGFHALNFLLLVGLLVWAGRGPLRDMLHQRALALRTGIDEAQALRAEAVARHEALTARLAALEAEVGEIHARATRDAEAEAARIVERAEAGAARLKETVSRQIRDEAARARQALRAEAVEIAVELAEGILRDQVSADDQQRLAAAFLDTVRSAEEAPHA